MAEVNLLSGAGITWDSWVMRGVSPRNIRTEAAATTTTAADVAVTAAAPNGKHRVRPEKGVTS